MAQRKKVRPDVPTIDRRIYRPTHTGTIFHNSPLLVKGIRGPVGSGKSVACCFDVFQKSCNQVPNSMGVRDSKWLFYRRHQTELELTTLATWLQWFPETRIKFDSPMTGYFECPHPSGDGTKVVIQLVLMGVESASDVLKLKSLELSGAWANEGSQIAWEIHTHVFSRLGRYPKVENGEGGSQIKFPKLGHLFDTNSPHESNWWREREQVIRDKNELWLIQPPALLREWVVRVDGKKGWQYSYNVGQDPRYLPAENVNNHNEGFGYWMAQVSVRDDESIVREILNQYGKKLDGMPIYEEFNDDWHYRPNLVTFVRGRLVIIGMDFGRTPAAVIMQMDGFGRILLIEEIVSKNMDVKQFCKELLKPKLMEYGWGDGLRAVVYCDPAGENPNEFDIRNQIMIVRESGIECYPSGDMNSFVIRRDCVKEQLRSARDGAPTLMISEKCPFLRKAFNGGYCYKKLPQGVDDSERYAPTPDKTNFYTHVMNAAEYGIYTLINGNRHSGGLHGGLGVTSHYSTDEFSQGFEDRQTGNYVKLGGVYMPV